MNVFLDGLILCFHALIAWVLVEIFVNNAHRLSRKRFLFFHYLAVILSFLLVFFLYFRFFSAFSLFASTMIAMTTVSFLEWVVFGFFYSGTRWFLNYVDWIFPMFLATSAIYFVGTLIL